MYLFNHIIRIIRKIMKFKQITLIITLLILITALILSSSYQRKNPVSDTSNVGEILKGNHELRRFNTLTKDGTITHGSFFLIGGSATSNTYSEIIATFSWKTNTGEYAISELPIKNIRVKIDPNVINPYIKFNWNKGNSKNIHYIMKWNVNYMVIVCREEDYPININLDGL